MKQRQMTLLQFKLSSIAPPVPSTEDAQHAKMKDAPLQGPCSSKMRSHVTLTAHFLTKQKATEVVTGIMNGIECSYVHMSPGS